ncbi:MAG: hypothetical protein JWR09_210 [Mucilaginibacter sp.]|nr:hypothetical protein [Mucilaginibacter sp.]
MKKSFTYLFSMAIILISIASCKKNKEEPIDTTINYSAGMVLKWNEAGMQAVAKIKGAPPMSESRIYAMLNLAMHDALNNIVQKYDTYALSGAADKDADPDAAVAQAAHDVLVSLLPAQQNTDDSLLTICLAGVTAGSGKEKGIAMGKAAAKAMIDKRANDGAATAQYPFTPGTLPGEYRATPPFDMPPFNGFVSLPGWGKVQPFSLASASQFRAAAPYSINSLEYTTDFNEIKTMGCMGCTARSADQTQIGLFWLDNIPLSWNRIARSLIVEKKLNGWKAARMLALLQMAEADANISAFDGKFFYKFWRPITAIRLGDLDGNPNTTGDAAWNLLAPPTPPAPDYPSNHAIDGGAAAEVLKSYFNTDAVSFSASSNALPGVTRNFNNFSDAAREVSLSRIYVGFHFRNAVMEGEAQGRKVGNYIFEHCLKEK